MAICESCEVTIRSHSCACRRSDGKTLPWEFSAEDLGLIIGMCMSANPWFPDKPMIPAWQSVYDTASEMLNRR